MDVKGKKITVIGAARSGIAAARLLKKHGALVFVTDSAKAEAKTNEMQMLQDLQIDFELGGHSDRALDADLSVISPGVPTNIPIVAKMRDKSLPILSEIEVASRWLKGTTIAVTGSNGKTTTTTWISDMCRRSNRPVITAGNIGTPLSDLAETSTNETLSVLEISSFQAEGLELFRPNIGVLMNLSADHMDRYDSVESYFLAKRRLFEKQSSQDSLIYNADDDAVLALIKDLPAKRVAFSLESHSAEGAFLRGDTVVAVLDGASHEIISTGQIGIPGRHNVYNAMAASLAALCAGIAPDDIRNALREFRGVEHRLERVRVFRGITYYNDSKATNVDSTVVALRSFPNEKIALILGGKHKGSSYSPLRPLIREKVKRVIAIGEAAPLIMDALGEDVKIFRAGSLSEAVSIATAGCSEGDIVLLSPACASFDMFKNYEDRGRQFKNAVLELK